MTTEQQPTQLASARANAQRTFDRRRARSAAETLANIPPNRWDDTTKQMIATLATISAPSRIDDLLAAMDGEDITAETNDDPYRDEATPYRTWDELPDGTTDLGEAFAAELDRMGLMSGARPAPPPYPTPRPRPDPDPRPRPEPHPDPERLGPECECGRYQGCDKCGRYRPRVHDNGDCQCSQDNRAAGILCPMHDNGHTRRLSVRDEQSIANAMHDNGDYRA